MVAAYQAQVRHAVGQAVARTCANMEHKREYYPFPLLSCFVHDCLEQGLDLSWGGGRYNHAYLQAVGTVNVVDSLMAIGHFVFDRRELTLPELVALCDADFDGAEARRLRASSSRAARTEEQAITQRLASVEAENRQLRRELQEAETKLEAITSIERSIREQD